MDPLTHSFFGMACAMAVTGRRSPAFGQAALAGLAAGLLPDADIFLKSDEDPLFTMEYHRHFTHSVLFSPVIAALAVLLTGGIVRLTGRRLEWRGLWLPAWLAALGHGFCDVWTSYGTRSWWPFSDARVTMDLVSVVDPLLTVPLVLAGAVALWARRRAWALTALGWVVLYLGFCQWQKLRAEEALRDWWVMQGLTEPDRSTVKPSFGNVIVWRGMTVHGTTFRVVALRCGWNGVDAIEGGEQEMFRSVDTAVAALGLKADSRQGRDVARFYHFSDGWVGLHPEDPRTLGDLRYAVLPNAVRPLWGIRLGRDEDDAAPVELRQFREVNGEMWRRFWAMIRGAGSSVEPGEKKF